MALAFPGGQKEKIELGNLVSRLGAVLALFVAALLTTLLAIWAAYDFRYSAAKNPPEAAAVEALVLPASSPAHEPGHFPIEYVLHRAAALKSELKSWPGGVPPEKRADFERRV